MDKLNRITLLDNTNRPKAPKISGITPEQRRIGKRLSLYHNHHRAQLREVESAMVQIDDTLLDKISALDMQHNFRVFGNMCGQECQMLSGHHGIEDHALFPELHRAGNAGLRKVVERLMAEHLVVHELIEELETMAHRVLETPTPENYAAIKSTFSVLHTCVQSHFGYEETELEEALSVLDVGI